MKTLLLSILACTTFFAFGASFEEMLPPLLGQCDAEDFDAREKAVAEMSKFPAPYAEKFLAMAKEEKNPEVQYRLRMAAKGVFAKTIAVKDERWLYFHGTLFLTGNILYSSKDVVDEEFPYWHHECHIWGMIVQWVDDFGGPCTGKIRQNDVIISIEGSGLNPINVKAGCDYVIHVRRYKDLKYIEDHGLPSSEATEKDWDEFDVTVTAGWQERRFVNEQAEDDLMDRLWKEFLEAHK